MTSKHTSGEWKARKLGNQFSIIAGDVHIATVLKRTERGSSLYDGAETEANANLIAAAPAQNEALHRVEAFIAEELETRRASMLPTTGGEYADYIEPAERALAIVRAAITTAEGK